MWPASVCRLASEQAETVSLECMPGVCLPLAVSATLGKSTVSLWMAVGTEGTWLW